jgi:hypothetical protein
MLAKSQVARRTFLQAKDSFRKIIGSNVDTFKFIGASSLNGPINKLQNALSFNYYANTHVYDYRADYIAKDLYLNQH